MKKSSFGQLAPFSFCRAPLLLGYKRCCVSLIYSRNYTQLRSDTTCQSCIPDVGCNLSVSVDFCYIPESGCWPNGFVFQQQFPDRKESICQLSCNTARSTSSWSPAPTGTPCDDGIFCNGHDICVYDQITDTSKCKGGSFGDPCENMTDFCNSTCNEKQRNCFRTEGTPCDDAQPLACTDASVCSQGRCAHVRNPVTPRCTDCADVCDSNHACNKSSGSCTPLLTTTRPTTRPTAHLPPHSELLWPVISTIIALVLVVVVSMIVFVMVKRARGRFSRLEYYHGLVEDENRSAGYFANNNWSCDE